MKRGKNLTGLAEIIALTALSTVTILGNTPFGKREDTYSTVPKYETQSLESYEKISVYNLANEKESLSRNNSNGKIVVLDPGHGMDNSSQGRYDPGCTFEEYEESELVLDQAFRVKRKLESLGYEVHLTREDRTDSLPLGSRIEKSKEYNPDLFVSLHINSFTENQAHGFEVNYNTPSDKLLAISILNQLDSKVKTWSPNRGVKQNGYRVLDGNPVPSVLVESGFLSNEKDREMLINHPEIYSEAIANGIDNYFLEN